MDGRKRPTFADVLKEIRDGGQPVGRNRRSDNAPGSDDALGALGGMHPFVVLLHRPADLR